MKKILLFILKLAVGLLVFKLVVRHIDWKNCANIIFTFKGAVALVVTTFLILLQYILAGSKVWFLLGNVGKSIKLKDIVASQFLGNFCAQFGFTFASGDVARGYYLYKKYGGLRDISAAIFCDRVSGFVAISLCFAVAMVGITGAIQNHQVIIYLNSLLAISFFAILTYFTLLFIPISFKFHLLSRLSAFVKQNKTIFFNKKNVKPMVLVSVGVALFNVIIVAVCGHILGLSLPFTSYFMITIPAMLMAMLPISIAGFGVRESSFVTGFSLLSHYGDFGLIISLLFGLGSLLASLPGVIPFQQLLLKYTADKSMQSDLRLAEENAL